MPEVGPLLERFRQGDRLALSRLLSLAARGEALAEIEAALAPATAAPKVVAITGSAGVGKSTLIGKLIEHVRTLGTKVAVLACDPQSPVSGGALLGDRFRMPDQTSDDGVFIRSLAALSGHGAVAEHLPVMARLLGAFGFDVVLIETVGAGQGDVTASQIADVVVLLLQPETGDDLQWEKAGVLEVADIIVVQKADLPRAEQVAAQVRSVLDLGASKVIPVVLVSAKTGRGVSEFWQHISAAAPHRRDEIDRGARLLQAAAAQMSDEVHRLRNQNDSSLIDLIRRWQRREMGDREAAIELLKLVLGKLGQHVTQAS